MSHNLDHASPLTPSALRRAAPWAAGLLLLLLAGAAARALSNAREAYALAEDSASDEVRHVLTVRARPAAALRDVTLPGTLRGRQEAAVHARTGGYLKRWTKDIGDTVRRGEVLAEIDAPEADQELRQARAARDQVRARSDLAQSSLARFEALIELDAVSRMAVDERRAAHTQAVADLAAAEANVKRLEALEALRRVVAPFDGVVLRRNAEVGILITPNAARELFYLAEIDVLRIELAVPQAYAADVQLGQRVQVSWPERPGKPIEGRISRAAPGIDTATRTRQVVIDVPNPERRLLPGSYVDVQLRGSELAAPPLLTVPPGVLQFRQDGPRVALVQDDRIVLRNLKLGRDLGREVEVRDGLNPQDRIVLNPPDTLTEGERVNARPALAEKTK